MRSTLLPFGDGQHALRAHSRLTVAPWLLALLLGALALLPRSLGLADFFTIDESYHWIGRVRDFSAALAHHRWADTDLTGHPGVTTMWLGAAGRWLAHALSVPDEHSALGPTTAYLALLRLPLALVNGAAVGGGYLLLRRLLAPATALLAALLWATSPFLIGFSRLLHVDGLVTTFTTLSILLLLLGDRRALVASGVCAGLALLSKASALVLLPWAGLALLALAPWPRGRRSALLAAGGRLTLWLAAAAVTFCALWPAMWVAPIASVGDIIHEVISNGGQPHASGNFFFGQSVADPGPAFYPVVVALRSTPITLLGLFGLPLALSGAWRARTAEQRTLLALLGFVLLFGVAVSAAEKKFDRYLLPAWPALLVLAAAGLVALGGAIARRLPPRRWLGPLAGGILLLALLASDAVYHPYAMAYYNPLFGGGATAEQVLLAGWGEGMEEVGAWLRARPDLERAPVLSWIPPTLQPFVPRTVTVLDIRPRTLALRGPPPLYAVLYARGAVRNESGDLGDVIAQTPALYTVRRFGITYATIHQVPRPFDIPRPARFGAGLALRGFSQERIGHTLVITPSWDVQQDQPGGVLQFVHVLGPDGRRVAQIDAPLDDGLYPAWQAGQQFGSALPIALPADLPRGAYRVVLGLYRLPGGARLPLAHGALPAAIDGPNTLLLTQLVLP